MRFDYRDWVLEIDPHNWVFVDESGLNLGMTRLYGRAPSGERLFDACPRNRGGNISFIGALSLDGLLATMSLPGSVNTDVFVTYVREILAPQLWRGAFVVMDNLSVHQGQWFETSLSRWGRGLSSCLPTHPISPPSNYVGQN